MTKYLNKLTTTALLLASLQAKADCDTKQPHLQIFICQGHSFFKIHNPNAPNYKEDYAYAVEKL